MSTAPCRFGYEEHDGARYCFEHYGFWEPGTSRRCHLAPVYDGLAELFPDPRTTTEVPF